MRTMASAVLLVKNEHEDNAIGRTSDITNNALIGLKLLNLNNMLIYVSGKLPYRYIARVHFWPLLIGAVHEETNVVPQHFFHL
jgi:hypothetical protein